jgi:hypothetical protein
MKIAKHLPARIYKFFNEVDGDNPKHLFATVWRPGTLLLS